MADKPYKQIYNQNNPPIILDPEYDDPDNINNVLPLDVEVGTIAIVADDSGHRYIFGLNGAWAPFVGSGGSGGGTGGCALAMTDVSTTGM